MVLVVRSDLCMQKGKIAAQCCHAAVEVVEDLIKRNDDMYKIWKQSGAKKVTVKISGQEELLDIYRQARFKKLPSEYIRDAGFTQVEAGSVTVCAILGPVEIIDSITGKLSLL
jgi:PTH2 family peptidyl-tRNA hydrolase